MKTIKIYCKNCKELLVKVYPYCPQYKVDPRGLYCTKKKCLEAKMMKLFY